MSVNNWITEKIILPASDLVLGQSIASTLTFLDKSQWWSAEELESYQQKKLQELVQQAYHHTRYYHDLFTKLHLRPEDIQTKRDLYKLPILSKMELKEQLKSKSIIASNIPLSKMIYSSSSGSTGEPLQYYMNKEAYCFSRAAAIRSWYWMGFRLGDKYVKLSQNPRSSKIKQLQDRFNNTLYLFSQQLTDENFKKIVDEIQAFKPTVIRGYPDPILFLANYIKRNAIKITPPKAIATTGNMLFPAARKVIEEQFGCKVFDSYSCEGGANVAECHTHECYHSTMEYAITEIIDHGQEVGPGQQGRVITTDLINYAVPLLRYDTQDYVVKSEKPCSCGRKLLHIHEVKGRDSDILITPSGKYLIVHNFTGYFEWIDSVDQFQVEQHTARDIEIRIKTNQKYTSQTEKEIIDYWNNYIGSDVKITLSKVDEIPLGKNGKRRFLLRNPDIQLDF